MRPLVNERGEGKPALDAARDNIIRLRDKAQESGIHLLTIRRKDQGDFIGYCGLITGRSTPKEPEIAYELFRKVRGNGFATEAASAVVEAAMATGRHRLWATVRSWNMASFRVLEKIGFERHHGTGYSTEAASAVGEAAENPNKGHMNMKELDREGYIPTYKRTKITDALHDV